MSEPDDEARRVRGALLQLGARDPRLLEMPLQVRGSLSDAQIRERVLLVAFSEFASDRVLSDWWSGEGMPLEHARRLARELGLASDSLDPVLREVLKPRETRAVPSNGQTRPGSGAPRSGTPSPARQPSPSSNDPNSPQPGGEILGGAAGKGTRSGLREESFWVMFGNDVDKIPIVGALWGMTQVAALVLPHLLKSIFLPIFKSIFVPKKKLSAPVYRVTRRASLPQAPSSAKIKTPQFGHPAVSRSALASNGSPNPRRIADSSSGIDGVLLRGGPMRVGEVLRMEKTNCFGPAMTSVYGPMGVSNGTLEVLVDDEIEVTQIGANRVGVKVWKRHRRSMTDFGVGPKLEQERRPLDGLVVLGSRSGDHWNFELEQGLETPERVRDLVVFAREFPSMDDRVYPEHSVKIGETWHLSSDAIRKYIGRGMETIEGTVKMTLKELLSRGAQRLARIEVNFDLTASGWTEENGDFYYCLKGLESVLRDVDSFVNIESKSVIETDMTEHVFAGGEKVKVCTRGPMVVTIKCSKRRSVFGFSASNTAT
jgi:hypothetical protein